jgi:hypothetical protein
VSLEGSLQTVALPEVLDLLADTSKDGELHVRGSNSDGRLWFEAGKLSGFAVGRTKHPVDALFDLLRVDNGEFVFDDGASRPETARVADGGDPVDIGPVVESAQARLVEWPEIVQVVPSLSHDVSLMETSPDPGVHLEADQWSLVVAIGEGRSVQAVLDRRELSEFDGCRSLKALVDAELVSVNEPVSATSVAGAPASDHDGLSDRGPWTNGELAELTHNDSTENADESEAEADSDAPQPVKQRGLLLKFLSSVGS